VQVFPSRLLHDPRAVKTKGGRPFQVFSAFWKRLQDELNVGADSGRPRLGSGRAPAAWPEGPDLEQLGLHPRHAWTEGLAAGWRVGEAAAHRRLRRFIAELLRDYPAARDLPEHDGSSRLSPHLHHGELSPRQVWNAVVAQVGSTVGRTAADAYLREIGWREFAYHLLYHNPETPTQPLREKFAAFPWRRSRVALEAWQQGRTGYPLVDAGMRQLWRTGWMHNRVRMVVASFLTKDLLIPWQEGARWFWDTLVDADLASNTLGWQWTAGCGADAQPFFRIFNPVSQSRKFDPEGSYIRRWVPELAGLPAEWIHWPAGAPEELLRAAGVRLGENYPGPMIDHADARDRALEAYNAL
jgi:deoxyribodipyrimidine photo-lyase